MHRLRCQLFVKDLLVVRVELPVQFAFLALVLLQGLIYALNRIIVGLVFFFGILGRSSSRALRD